MKRMNGKELAAALNISVWSIYAMKRAGAPFYGRYATLWDIDRWWREHPGFCASQVWRSQPKASQINPGDRPPKGQE